MAKVYLPETINNNQCVVVQTDGRIRVYDSRPNGTQQNVTYRDYYLREDYLMTSSSTTWNAYTSITCMDSSQFTTDQWYRPDIWQTFICTFFIALIGFYLPFKIFARMFGRWLKL